MSDENKDKFALEGIIRLIEKCGAFHGRIEDLMFRAQRIASAMKTGRTLTDRDFDPDLKLFRSDLRKFRFEMEEVLTSLRTLYDGEPGDLHARFVSLRGRLDGLVEYISLAHQRMPRPDSRLEAWYCLREINEMLDFLKLKSIPRPT